MKIKMITVLSAALVLGASAAQAEGFYALGAVGQSNFENVDKGEMDRGLAGAGLTGLSSSLDDSDTAWKLQLGYQFNENFALEGGYYNLGKLKYNAIATQGTLNASQQVDGWNVNAVGILPLSDRFSLLGKVGTAYSTSKVDVSGTANGALVAATSSDESKWGVTYGVGLGYAITQAVALRAEYERYDDVGDGDKVGVWSLGIAFKF